MCDVPSIAVFCSESIECFPGTASKFFLKLLVTIPVTPIIIGITVHLLLLLLLLLLLILLLLSAIEFSLGGNSPYGSTNKTNKIKYTYMKQ